MGFEKQIVDHYWEAQAFGGEPGPQEEEPDRFQVHELRRICRHADGHQTCTSFPVAPWGTGAGCWLRSFTVPILRKGLAVSPVSQQTFTLTMNERFSLDGGYIGAQAPSECTFRQEDYLLQSVCVQESWSGFWGREMGYGWVFLPVLFWKTQTGRALRVVADVDYAFVSDAILFKHCIVMVRKCQSKYETPGLWRMSKEFVVSYLWYKLKADHSLTRSVPSVNLFTSTLQLRGSQNAAGTDQAAGARIFHPGRKPDRPGLHHHQVQAAQHWRLRVSAAAFQSERNLWVKAAEKDTFELPSTPAVVASSNYDA